MIADGTQLVTDAEVLQEIPHGYVAIHRRDAIESATLALLGVVDEVFPVDLGDAQRAASILISSDMRSRDALHLAVMHRRSINQIMTFDRGLDRIPGIRRVGEPG